MHRRDKKYLAALFFGGATTASIFALLPTLPPWIEDAINWRGAWAVLAGFFVLVAVMLLANED
ncbi:MAG: hypothetical protein WAU74_03835 [Pseudolabrys sp.]